jgi:hypothetical protein
MATESITIPVDPVTARAYEAALPEERRKLELLLRLRLRELTTGPSRPLKQIMDELGQEAESRGLTPEILESLLNGK